MGSSASLVAGLLHPAADPGVRRVSVPHGPVKPVRSTLSRDAGPTLRRNPRRKPLCVTADLALLAVLSGSPPSLARFHCWRSCSDSVGGSGTSASRPCSVVGSGVFRGCCQLPKIRSFLGFVPLQGSSSNDRGSHALAVPQATSEDVTCKLRFAPGREVHRGERRSDRAPLHTEVSRVGTAPVGPVPGPPSARSEDRGWSRARRSIGRSRAGEGHCERGSGRSRLWNPTRIRIPSLVHRACVHERPSCCRQRAGGVVPSTLAFALVESGRPRCYRSLSGAEVARVGPQWFPAASRRSRRPS